MWNGIKMKNILLLGKMGGGKTTLAKYLEKQYNYNIISFATPIKQIAIDTFGMKDKDRYLLQVIGKTGRAIKPNVWIELLLEKIEKDKLYVIDDCRFINEFDELVLRNTFIPIFVSAWEQLRVIRCVYSGQEVSRKYLEDTSETGIDDIANHIAFDPTYQNIVSHTIMNTYSLDKFYNAIEEVFKKINR